MNHVRLLKYEIGYAGRSAGILPGDDAEIAVAAMVGTFEKHIFRSGVDKRYEDDLLDQSCMVDFPDVLLNLRISAGGHEVLQLEIPVMYYCSDDQELKSIYCTSRKSLSGTPVSDRLACYERQQEFESCFRVSFVDPRDHAGFRSYLNSFHAPKWIGMMRTEFEQRNMNECRKRSICHA